ncbi:ABC transporter substrate-binding protein [Anaerocolumna sp. AGMB13025]|uniref:ABC transporter substrate-binding protein n=1 Tax=Anaerocolumna sp. AGMB13025 TaxID=3039116 RepID=UPI00241C189F|nr:ABC transporter substrate-binding protein [Anaerocolumna sp. AGMB13025]WFR56263.1 ABC transporter substrate-binding protein [Anaerocolumna sp. AGMB13025]
MNLDKVKVFNKVKVSNAVSVRILLTLCVILTASFVLTGCSKEKNTLTVGVMTDLDSIPLIVAKQQGYFSDNVKLEIYQSPVDRDSALFSGNLDGSISDVLAVCLAKDGDFPVYATSKTYGRYGIVAGKDSGITNAKQLEGKEIGLSLNTIIEYVTDSMVSADGGDPSQLKKTSVPKIPSRLELLQNNQIDAVAMPEPYVSAAGTAGGIIVNTSDKLGINPGVMLFTKAAVEKKSDEIKAFYEAYDKAVDYINSTDQKEFMPAVIKETGLPETALTIELPQYEKTSLPEKEQVLDAMQWLYDRKLIKQAYTYEDLVKKVNE